MCTASVGDIIMGNAVIQELMAKPDLDLIHKQVLMTLYALDAQKQLGDHKTILPIYLSMDWKDCEEILRTLESVGLITLDRGSILMNYPIDVDSNHSSCGCAK